MFYNKEKSSGSIAAVRQSLKLVVRVRIPSGCTQFSNMEEVIRVLLNKDINCEEAKILLREYEYRIVYKDGQPYMVTCDFHPTRMNLYITGNIIKKITLG